jgi:hypothetical protein
MAPRAPEPFHESLPEALRQVERTLDDQRAAVEALHRKNEQSIALGAGALGGGLALVVLLVEKTGVHLDAALLGLMLGGATLDLAAVVVLVFAGLAASTELHLGPDVRWLREKALDETWSLLEMRLSLVAAAPRWVAFNRAQMARGVRRRRAGLSLLVLAAAFDGVACVYIGWRMVG